MVADQALVLAGHGSHHDARSAAPVAEHADRIRARGCFDVVRTAFWKEQPSLAEVLGTVAAESVYVVPFLTSDGYFADRVFPGELGLRDGPAGVDSAVVYTEPVGTHDRLRDVVVDRVRAVTAGEVDDDDVAVALVGHGTDRHDRSADATATHADRLRADGRFAAVEAFFLDQEPSVAALTDRFDGPEVVVVPLFVSNGQHVRRDVPAAVGLPVDGDPFGGPRRVGDHRVWYTEAVGTAPSLTGVVLDRAAEAGADVRARQRRPSRSDAEAAFLRWLRAGREPGSAAAGTHTRIWGELAITLSVETHGRRYSIRHEADRDIAGAGLEHLPDATAVRARTGIDGAGNHRPLRTARTLPTGWRYETADPDDAVRAVRAVYPAAIDHWFDGRDGRLEVTAFETVVSRQAGRYRDLDAVDPSTFTRTVHACCGDCVRDRAWTAESVNAEPTNGSVPCPEPCSFLLEAVRSLAELEPADGIGPADPSVPAAAFDHPGNRYRVRFQRAHRASEAREPAENEPLTGP